MTGLSLGNSYGLGLRMPTPGYSGQGLFASPQASQAFTTPALSRMGTGMSSGFNMGGILGGMGQQMLNQPQVPIQWNQTPFSQMQVENAYDIIRRLYGGAYV